MMKMGNLINPDSDPGASYPQTQEPPLSRQYRNGLHLVERIRRRPLVSLTI